MTHEATLHPYVSEIVAAATIDRDHYLIPEKALKGIEAKLRSTYLDELPLFVHLVVTASRLRKSGLPAFADQLIQLATIGLDNKARPPPKAADGAAAHLAPELKPAPQPTVGLRSKPKK